MPVLCSFAACRSSVAPAPPPALVQALVLQRGGRKILAEAEPDGRRWVAALAALVTAGPGSMHLTHGDSQAVPSGLARAATAPGLLRSQSIADTATTEAESEPMQIDSLAAAEGDVDPAGYSSFEETDLEEDEAEHAQRARQAGAAQHRRPQQAAALFELARDAVLVQPWDAAAPLPAGGAAAPAPAQAGEQARQQQGAQPPAAEGGAHSQEWRAARRGVEWRVRWLELRLTELQHQRRHYQQQLTAERQREEAAAAAQQAAAAAPSAGQQQQQQQQQQQGKAAQQDAAQSADQKPAAAAGKPPLAPSARLRARHERQPLPGCQLPDLLQHPFVAQHSVVGARAAAAAGSSVADAQEAGPSAIDSDDFPAEAHAALELLDQKLSSLRRQLMALQQPAAGGAFRGMPAVRLPGRPAGAGRRPGGSGMFTPRSGGATPRGTPRAGSLSLYRDGSLSKRRRVQVCAGWECVAGSRLDGRCSLQARERVAGWWVVDRTCKTDEQAGWHGCSPPAGSQPAQPTSPCCFLLLEGVRRWRAHHPPRCPQVCGAGAGQDD